MAKRSAADKQKAIALRKQGRTFKQISEALNIPVGTISTWCRQHETKVEGAADNVRPLHEHVREPRATPITPPPDEEPGPQRERDRDPEPPQDAQFVGPAEINFRQLQDYIAGGYKLAGKYAIESEMNPILGSCIIEHADECGRAWAAWIESEPKVAALLQRMMIATPAGELVRVHLSIGLGYFFARQAVLEARRRAEEQQRADQPEPAAAAA